MVKLSLTSGMRVKMQIIQPSFICNGRRETTCYYRGRVIEVKDNIAIISFKRYGELISAEYDLIKDMFIDPEFEDIKIKSWK